jgi:C4-dicarboxylate-specific signal transduction histidine kinase
MYLLVATFAAVAAMLGVNTLETRWARARVAETLDVQDQVTSLRVWINRASTDSLAFILGSDLGSEASWTRDEATALASVLHLRSHFAGDPVQLERVVELEGLIAARSVIEHGAMEAAKGGGPAAGRDVLSASGWSAGRERVRSITTEMLADIRHNFQLGEERYSVVIQRLRLAVGGFFAVMVGTFVFLLQQLRVSRQSREEAQRAHELARRSELLYREMARNFPNGAISLFDRDLRFLVFDGSQFAFRRDAASNLGRTLFEIFPPDVAARIAPLHRDAIDGREGRIETEINGRNIQIHACPIRDETGEVIMGIATSQDVTEERSLRTQLAVSSRLASLGTLVAGVAHEVNNPLAGTLSSLATAIEEQREISARLRGGGLLDREALAVASDEVVEILLDAQVGGDRITRIVKDLALFGRPNPMRTRVRLCDVVTASMRWLPASVGRVATVRVDDLGAPDVHGSSGQLEQVVVNLVTNAAFAIPEDRRGEVAIRIFESESGGGVLEVKDNGRGIDLATMERIFDPFFTTREVGHGMGLGLPICHAIVTAHGGTLTATSLPGKGSTFRLELPPADAVE